MFKRIIYGLLTFLCLLSLAACSKGQPVSDVNGECYHVETEYNLGREDTFLVPETGNGQAPIYDRTNCFFYKGGIACLVSVFEDNERTVYLCQSNLSGGDQTYNRLSFSQEYSIESVKVLPDGELYVLYCKNAVNEFDGTYLGKVVNDRIEQIFKRDELTGTYLFGGNGKDRFWLCEVSSSVVREYDSNGNTIGTVDKGFQVTSIVNSKYGGQAIIVENNVGTMLLDNGGEIIELNHGVINPSPWGSLLEFSSDGSAYICQTDRIFKDEESVFDFALNDYMLSAVLDFKVIDDGFDIIVLIDNSYSHVVLKKGAPKQNKKEIILATGYIKKNLQKAAAAFNRANDRYHVTIRQMDDYSVDATHLFFSDVHKQLAKGEGPDLVTNDVLTDLEDFVISGYLAPIELSIDKDAFIDSIFDVLSYDNKIYGIPYEFSVKTVIASAKAIDNEGPFSAEAFMNLVEKSGVETVHCGIEPIFLLINYFLGDISDSAYIDWENGISHLDEDGFKRVLSFSKKYADHTESENGNTHYEAEYIKKGKALCKEYVIEDTYDELNEIREMFSEDYCYIGYPASNSNGTIIQPNSIFLSSFAKEKEGALEFLEFVISEEYQRIVAEAQTSFHENIFDTSIGDLAELPVLKNTFEYAIDSKRNRGAKIYIMTPTGLNYWMSDLTDTEIDNFKKAVYGASSLRGLPQTVMDIIWEETSPYFDDQCSLDEAAEKLHNRMQLYLDERKNR